MRWIHTVVAIIFLLATACRKMGITGAVPWDGSIPLSQVVDAICALCIVWAIFTIPTNTLKQFLGHVALFCTAILLGALLAKLGIHYGIVLAF